jgi:hypothetical protein
VDFEELDLQPGDLPTGVLVGSVEVSDCTGYPGDYEWHLASPQRLRQPIKSENHPLLVFGRYWSRVFTQSGPVTFGQEGPAVFGQTGPWRWTDALVRAYSPSVRLKEEQCPTGRRMPWKFVK